MDGIPIMNIPPQVVLLWQFMNLCLYVVVKVRNWRWGGSPSGSTVCGTGQIYNCMHPAFTASHGGSALKVLCALYCSFSLPL